MPEPKPEPPKPQVTVDRKKPQPSNADRDAIIKEIQKNIKDAPKVSAEPKATIVAKTNRNAGAERNLSKLVGAVSLWHWLTLLALVLVMRDCL